MPQTSRGWRPDAILLLAVGTVFVASLFAPRSGSAVLLVPFTELAGQQALQWALAHDAHVLGRSVFGGIVLDNAPDQTFINALKAGTLAISVPAAACISRPMGNR